MFAHAYLLTDGRYAFLPCDPRDGDKIIVEPLEWEGVKNPAVMAAELMASGIAPTVYAGVKGARRIAEGQLTEQGEPGITDTASDYGFVDLDRTAYFGRNEE